MKTLLLITILFPAFAMAKTEILQSGNSGFSYIDPLTNKAYITVRSDVKNGSSQQMFRVSCKLDSGGKPIMNYFVFKKNDENGISRNFKVLQRGLSCKQIEADDAAKQPDGVTSVQGCREFAAPEITVQDPPEGKCGTDPNFVACEFASAPVDKQVTVDLNNDAVKQARDKCGGDSNPLMIVSDNTTEHSLFSNLDGESACNLEKRRVMLDGSSWDGCQRDPSCKNNFMPTSPYTQIYTSKEPGFNIGAMTNPSNKNQPDSVMGFNYDFNKGMWCQHILPDYGNSSPTCDPAYNHMTFPLNFSMPTVTNNKVLNKTMQNGVVELGMEGDTPVAYIGSPKNKVNEPNPRPELDPTKPVIKVTLKRSSENGASTQFESKKTKTGPTQRTLTVASTYEFGEKFNSSATGCDSSMCLRAPSQFATARDTEMGLTCTNNQKPLDVSADTGNDLCYSCNGVTPGKCKDPARTEKDPDGSVRAVYSDDRVNSTNYTGLINNLNSCRGGTPADPTTVLPTIEQ